MYGQVQLAPRGLGTPSNAYKYSARSGEQANAGGEPRAQTCKERYSCMTSHTSWYEASSFLTHFDYHPSPHMTPLYGRHLDPETARAYLLESRPDLIYVPALGCFGYAAYDSSIAPSLEGYGGDFAKIWRKACDEQGVRMGLYIASFETHPLVPIDKHYILDSDGNVERGWACPNGPWAREFFIPFCLEAIERFAPAALWMDGTRTRPCYCNVCRALFAEEYGTDLVPPADANSRALANAFSEKSLVECMRAITTAIKARYPDVIINYANAPEYFYLRDMRGIADYFSSDGTNEVSLKHVQFDAAWRSTCGLPSDLLVFDQVIMGRDFDLSRYGTFGFRPRPTNLIVTECACQLAHGNRVCIYYSVDADGVVRRDKVDTAAKISRFVRGRAGQCVGNDSAANVAVLAGKADNMRLQDRHQSWMRMPSTMHQILTLCHIPADLVRDDILVERIAQYDVVIICESEVILPDTAETLRRFAESGKTVLVIGGAPKFALPWQVEPDGEPVFGLSSPLGSESVCHWNEDGEVRVGLLRKPVGRYEVIERVRDLNGEPSVPLLVSTPAGSGRVLWLLSESLSEYAERRVKDTVVSSEHPYLRRFLGRVVRNALGENWLLESDAAPGVEFVVNRRGRDLLVHAVNLVPGFSPDRLDAYVDEQPVLADVEFRIRLDREPTSVAALYENPSVCWAVNDLQCRVRMDRLHVHEAVMFADVVEDR